MTRRLGGGVPLVASDDREEVIVYKTNIVLQRTKINPHIVRRT